MLSAYRLRLRYILSYVMKFNFGWPICNKGGQKQVIEINHPEKLEIIKKQLMGYSSLFFWQKESTKMCTE